MFQRADLIAEIEKLKAELKSHEAMLKAYDKHALDKQSGPEVRFYQMRPLEATRQVLREAGKALSQEEITRRLVAGGATLGKKRAESNIRISIEISTGPDSNKLKKVGGLIGLPEWDDAKFVT
ncbi:hypothetical protein [Edaphobacter albus]|uniref:hypothetical protein n=1 Tax=Edaphobacter sp. 4G125 TaxID=2763071 RepID=UPI00164541A1|nr:hypothetical protein [Edaphobacter sp. 4G125]QNI37540.1 hypothetical protein H7846_04345 [Edaphobacter sp. 4G125]